MNAEVIAVPFESGVTIREGGDRGVCTSAHVPNLRIRPKVPAETWDDTRDAGELVTQPARELVDRIVAGPCTVVASRNPKLIRLHIDVEEGRDTLM
jgi:hypothetical protein